MKKPNTYILVGEIVLIISVVSILGYFAYGFFKRKREEKETKATGNLANQLEVSGSVDLLSKNKATKDKQYADAKKMDLVKIGNLIYSAKGAFNDDEQNVYAGFSLIPNLFALSSFQNYFKNLYKIDLFTFLNSFLHEDELKKVNDIVKKLK